MAAPECNIMIWCKIYSAKNQALANAGLLVVQLCLMSGRYQMGFLADLESFSNVSSVSYLVESFLDADK